MGADNHYLIYGWEVYVAFFTHDIFSRLLIAAGRNKKLLRYNATISQLRESIGHVTKTNLWVEVGFSHIPSLFLLHQLLLTKCSGYEYVSAK